MHEQTKISPDGGLHDEDPATPKAQGLHGAAEKGIAATDRLVALDHHHSSLQHLTSLDRHGHSLVTFDPKAERRLVHKIDFCIVPTAALLYLFCFIDRANIGISILHTT